MSKLTRGQLTLLEPSGKVHKFGSPAIYSAEYPNPDKGATSGVADSLEVTLRVVADAFWLRMLLQSDLGFAESYMQGEVECSDLAGMFQVSGAGGAGPARVDTAVGLDRVLTSLVCMTAAVHSEPEEPGRVVYWVGWRAVLWSECASKHSVRKLNRQRNLKRTHTLLSRPLSVSS